VKTTYLIHLKSLIMANNTEVRQALTTYISQTPESPLEPSTGTTELATTPTETVEAAPVEEEAKKPERKSM
jgi:hypothetical protein